MVSALFDLVVNYSRRQCRLGENSNGDSGFVYPFAFFARECKLNNESVIEQIMQSKGDRGIHIHKSEGLVANKTIQA